MALSNMGREPRRELTESAVGLVVCAVVLGLWLPADYWFAEVLKQATLSDPGGPCPITLGMFLGAFTTVCLIFMGITLVHLTHYWGEKICDALARHGYELRPRRPDSCPEWLQEAIARYRKDD